MTDSFPIVEEVVAWISGRREVLESRGMTVAVDLRPPRWAVSVSIDHQHLFSQLIVWESGDAQLMRANILDDANTDEHRQINSRADLAHVLDEFAAWTSAGN
ncbi:MULTISPECIES: hypothetical protein [Amycolatopsis]|uniref:hypothetical protein n=1 Tax=Amycolatopsis sp. cg13 TaxID=3238807 RepID=UPI0035249FF8